MASSYRIFCNQHRDNLHIKLMGDFAGSSAHEFINTLKKYRGIARRAFIHTHSLWSVHSFGLDVFQKNCAIKKQAHVLNTGMTPSNTAGIGTALASLNLLCGRHYINRAGQLVRCTDVLR